jgi:hypothetical protein
MRKIAKEVHRWLWILCFWQQQQQEGRKVGRMSLLATASQLTNQLIKLTL